MDSRSTSARRGSGDGHSAWYRSVTIRHVTRVVIAGGGASGALVAANLLRLGGPELEVVVVEPRAGLGLGVAYSTQDPWHG